MTQGERILDIKVLYYVLNYYNYINLSVVKQLCNQLKECGKNKCSRKVNTYPEDKFLFRGEGVCKQVLYNSSIKAYVHGTKERNCQSAIMCVI